jgi:hypothetical protein
MGGKNHQPCGIYLAESTKLSRFLSLAHSELELSNVALEDLILAELGKGRGEMVTIKKHLELSGQALGDAIDMVWQIRGKMVDKNFADLPTLRKLDLEALGASLAAKGLVDEGSWKSIARTMAKGGFSEVLLIFEKGIKSLSEKTSSLMVRIGALKEPARRGEVNLVLEENRQGNIREAFADIYTAWTKFNQVFLASSLLSTELWYAFNGYGSLAGREAQLKAV